MSVRKRIELRRSALAALASESRRAEGGGLTLSGTTTTTTAAAAATNPPRSVGTTRERAGTSAGPAVDAVDASADASSRPRPAADRFAASAPSPAIRRILEVLDADAEAAEMETRALDRARTRTGLEVEMEMEMGFDDGTTRPDDADGTRLSVPGEALPTAATPISRRRDSYACAYDSASKSASRVVRFPPASPALRRIRELLDGDASERRRRCRRSKIKEIGARSVVDDEGGDRVSSCADDHGDHGNHGNHDEPTDGENRNRNGRAYDDDDDDDNDDDYGYEHEYDDEHEEENERRAEREAAAFAAVASVLRRERDLLDAVGDALDSAGITPKKSSATPSHCDGRGGIAKTQSGACDDGDETKSDDSQDNDDDSQTKQLGVIDANANAPTTPSRSFRVVRGAAHSVRDATRKELLSLSDIHGDAASYWIALARFDKLSRGRAGDATTTLEMGLARIRHVAARKELRSALLALSDADACEQRTERVDILTSVADEFSALTVANASLAVPIHGAERGVCKASRTNTASRLVPPDDVDFDVRTIFVKPKDDTDSFDDNGNDNNKEMAKTGLSSGLSVLADAPSSTPHTRSSSLDESKLEIDDLFDDRNGTHAYSDENNDALMLNLAEENINGRESNSDLTTISIPDGTSPPPIRLCSGENTNADANLVVVVGKDDTAGHEMGNGSDSKGNGGGVTNSILSKDESFKPISTPQRFYHSNNLHDDVKLEFLSSPTVDTTEIVSPIASVGRYTELTPTKSGGPHTPVRRSARIRNSYGTPGKSPRE